MNITRTLSPESITQRAKETGWRVSERGLEAMRTLRSLRINEEHTWLTYRSEALGIIQYAAEATGLTHWRAAQLGGYTETQAPTIVRLLRTGSAPSAAHLHRDTLYTAESHQRALRRGRESARRISPAGDADALATFIRAHRAAVMEAEARVALCSIDFRIAARRAHRFGPRQTAEALGTNRESIYRLRREPV